jgi:hypothetical protein
MDIAALRIRGMMEASPDWHPSSYRNWPYAENQVILPRSSFILCGVAARTN